MRGKGGRDTPGAESDANKAKQSNTRERPLAKAGQGGGKWCA
jgi:hypothetical protein